MAIFSTFNPSAMPSDLIEGAFVQRELLAERLVDIFEESARRESKHNVLLVGPRGIGKSHLVSLVYHRLKAKKDLADKLSIAYLKEDEWGINSFLDLLMRTSRAAFEEAGLEPNDSFDQLSGLSRTQAEDHVWRALKEMLGSKTLLLIIENLDAVFEKIGEHGQRQWRALMQTNPQWAILATTPALFSGISRQVSPFYGFFEVIHLQPLSIDDAVALLQRLAQCNKDEKTVAFLSTAVGRARVRAVQHLAGGNHRIFVLFYDFLHQSGSEHFVGPLLKTVDALTPYYQAQMIRLSPQQQKIVNFLCEHRNPATVTVIAKNCLATHQTAASQLRQLLTHRYVRVDRVGRESFYELAEPLLRICVEVKTHREQPLHLLVDFVRYWFSREELEQKLSRANDSNLEKPYLLAALQKYDTGDVHDHLSPEIAALCVALSLERHTPDELKAKAQELAELSQVAEDWAHYARAMNWLDRESEAIPKLEEVLEKNPDNISILRWLAALHGSAGSVTRAEALLDRALALSPTRPILYLDKGQLLARTERTREALEAFDEAVRLNPKGAKDIAIEKARVLLKREEYSAAREVLSPFLSKGHEIPHLLVIYGVTFAEEDKMSEALEYFSKATMAFEGDPYAWGNRGHVLCNLGKYEEALECLDRSLALNPNERGVLHSRCQALFETRQFDVAFATVAPEILSHYVFHQLLNILNAHPRQGELQQQLSKLKNAHDSATWQAAILGGLTEMASLARTFESREALDELRIWNSAIQEMFVNQNNFSILLKLFDVLMRVKVLDDRKALLELPREQRLLIVGEKEEEDFLDRSEVPG